MIDYTISTHEIEYFLLIFVRIASFIFSAAFFSTKGVPRQPKIALSIFISYLMYTNIYPHEYPSYSTILGYGTLVLKEAAVGLIIGVGTQLCTSIVLFAGRIMDMEIGLSMANVFDPSTQQQASVTGMLIQYGVLIILYISGLHRYLIKALMETYELIPVCGAVINTDKLLQTFADFLSNYIVIGFRICLPVFASITLMNIVLGLLAKLAPQMNMFSVGIQLKLLAGLVVLLFTVQLLPTVCNFITTQIQQMMVSIVEGLMPPV
ncbi:MAG: flagellar biosynthetic protein FliR [Lachnospiraceae bacterium]|nr:flagellar biosynthetic protein FliR [Lachnospiraceae bacterium]MBQ2407259.1 flagellar biosynthetic protein FliR [Lachnospiraceae bacterium]MBQ5851567.1 flagellar biosynthetic protein FliR [Lachnospiraceae bacterium]MEE0920653.1 flagellar biosynthetic protein FliR [Lachnospiraceae bacterium]